MQRRSPLLPVLFAVSLAFGAGVSSATAPGVSAPAGAYTCYIVRDKNGDPLYLCCGGICRPY